MERIYLTKEKVDHVIEKLRYYNHMERYLMVRRFVFGNVLDFGCGIGYGSNLVSLNPNVESVTGLDISEEALLHARKEFANEKTNFVQELDERKKFDVMICFEVIEHLKNPEITLKPVVDKVMPYFLFISFPNKASLKYNKFHFHDFAKQDIVNMFPDYICFKSKDMNDVTILFFVRSLIDSELTAEMFKNIDDIWK